MFNNNLLLTALLPFSKIILELSHHLLRLMLLVPDVLEIICSSMSEQQDIVLRRIMFKAGLLLLYVTKKICGILSKFFLLLKLIPEVPVSLWLSRKLFRLSGLLAPLNLPSSHIPVFLDLSKFSDEYSFIITDTKDGPDNKIKTQVIIIQKYPLMDTSDTSRPYTRWLNVS